MRVGGLVAVCGCFLGGGVARDGVCDCNDRFWEFCESPTRARLTGPRAPEGRCVRCDGGGRDEVLDKVACRGVSREGVGDPVLNEVFEFGG